MLQRKRADVASALVFLPHGHAVARRPHPRQREYSDPDRAGDPGARCVAGAQDAAGSLDATIADIIRREIAPLVELLEALAAPERPELMTGAQLSESLQVSVRTIDRLRVEGLPTIVVGDSPRYRLADVLTWLETREAGP